tara:strand:+ start:287 stop:1012 length:726 start_codon:yes stop_codon:yes gene_type:complete
MALPVITVMKYELTIPSTGEKVQFRPFLVKEEKILMMAMQSGESKDLIRALKDIVKNCIESELDFTKLATFDIEYIFLQLRARSIGDMIELSYSEPQELCERKEKQTCVFDIKFNIDDVKIQKSEDHKSLLDITDTIKMKMKYPIFEQGDLLSDMNDVDTIFEVIKSCIDYIMDGEEMHKISDYTEEEVDRFLNSLSTDQFKLMTSFFETMPKLSKEVVAKCNQCGKEQTKVLEGLQDFFV